MADGMMVRFDGVAAFEAALEASVVAHAYAANVGVARGANLIETRAKQLLTTWTHRKGEPTNSPPGQPPALVTGALRRSIRRKVISRASASRPLASVQIGPTIVYARIQELGGRAGRGSQLPPRPYFEPAVKWVTASGELYAAFWTAWRDAAENIAPPPDGGA